MKVPRLIVSWSLVTNHGFGSRLLALQAMCIFTLIYILLKTVKGFNWNQTELYRLLLAVNLSNLLDQVPLKKELFFADINKKTQKIFSILNIRAYTFRGMIFFIELDLATLYFFNGARYFEITVKKVKFSVILSSSAELDVFYMNSY